VTGAQQRVLVGSEDKFTGVEEHSVNIKNGSLEVVGLFILIPSLALAASSEGYTG
jgi:hypothetical protein